MGDKQNFMRIILRKYHRYLSMKRFIFFICLAFINALTAQNSNYTVNWKGVENVSTNGIIKEVPSFNNSNFSYINGIGLRFVDQMESGFKTGEKLVITNLVYEKVNKSELHNLPLDEIPNDIAFNSSSTQARDKSLIYFSFSPLIREDGQLKKVVSFSVTKRPENQVAKTSFRESKISISNSVLASGAIYKFYIEKTGIYKIDRNFLRNLGMDTGEINPSNLKIYGNGGAMLSLRNQDNTYFDPRENAIKVVGGDDGSFDSGDYILFYGESTEQFNAESLTHVNAYADRSYYFITADGATGKRVGAMTEPAANATTTFTTFQDYQFYEKDEENLLKLGRRWFGERFDVEENQSFEFDFPNRVANSKLDMRVYVAAISESTTSFDVTVNSNKLTTLSLSPISESVLARDRSYDSFLSPTANPPIAAAGDEVVVDISYNNNGNPSSQGYLDFIAIGAERELKGTGNQMIFQNPNAANLTGVGKYEMSGASSVSAIWEVTNPTAIKELENTENNIMLSFKTTLGTAKKFAALSTSDFYSPQRENGKTEVVNQNLKGTLFQSTEGFKDIDYLIITGELLQSQAEKLAAHNRSFRGLNVKVVTLEQIYNEFGSGKADIGAIRNLVRYVYENASSAEKRIKYLCLFGDTSIDYKNRIRGNNNIVPTFQTYYSFSQSTSYMSDDYFGCMDPEEGLIEYSSPVGNGVNDRLDIAVGRILADTPELAENVVNKIINYDDRSSLGRWHNNFVLVSDDVDNNWEFTELENTLDRLGDRIQQERPSINVIKIHSDSYQQVSSAGGDRYPAVNEAIADAIEAGTLVLAYLGHGGEDQLASEAIFTHTSAKNLKNQEKLPLIITVTCEFTRFDNPTKVAAGEELFWNSQGGAVGLVATTRQISVSLGVKFNQYLASNLFFFGSNTLKSVAENLRETKNQIPDAQRRVIFFIGDPAMKLAFGSPDIKLTKINDVPIGQVTDTLKGLSRMRFEGEVTSAEGQRLTDYNGNLSTTIYDKFIDRQTLGNDGIRENGELLIMDFKTLGAILYRGQAKIVNGAFDFEFVVPKDVSIPYGNGRVNFYAYKNDVFQQNSGANSQIVIGGLDENAPEDNTGPKIQLYMNDEGFVNGGITNESPILLAKLNDENGINTASGIGHDLVAILDGDETNPIILNDFYESDQENFKKGTASRKLRDLEPGAHTVTVKAWDTYNNSSTADLEFVVAGDDNVVLENVLNYPNPFVDYTEFWFDHNRPSEPLEVQVQIFTVTGKVVKTINQTVVNTGNRSRDIIWDGRDDFGDPIGKGVYVYKISVKSTFSEKLVEKIEKLVIL